jgi:DNA modification methylase
MCITSPPYWRLRADGRKGAIGQERTVDAYVANLVSIFREVARVLRVDGTLWLNIGDTFVEKGLQGVPWSVALALKSDGWLIRNDAIWSKPNPQPCSATDRMTQAHEYVFLLTRSPRYYYDNHAIREPVKPSTLARDQYTRVTKGKDGPYAVQHDHETPSHPLGRNRWDVWTIACENFPGQHYATFPCKLVEPCVLAGTSEKGVCPECGAPWQREVDIEYVNPGNRSTNGPRSLERRHETPGFPLRLERRSTSVGWRPGCNHGLDPVPATVLDPFVGSGTTLIVTEALGRHGIGCDLDPECIAMARRRLEGPHPWARHPHRRRRGEAPPLPTRGAARG